MRPKPELAYFAIADISGYTSFLAGVELDHAQDIIAAPRCKAKSKRTGKSCRAPAVRGCSVCRMHGARGGAPTGKQNGIYRHGTRTKEAIQPVRYVNLLSRLARKS
jgi:hypothetical protein